MDAGSIKRRCRLTKDFFVKRECNQSAIRILAGFQLLMIVSLNCGAVLAQADESEDHDRVFQYLHEASKLTEDVAYRFEGQYTSSRDGSDPSLKLLRGFVIRSKEKDFEYYSIAISQIPTSNDHLGMSIVTHQELFRIGSKRFRKNYAIPADNSPIKALGTNKLMGPLPEMLGVDPIGNPVPGEIPKFCAFGFPFATPQSVFMDKHNVNLCIESFLTRWVVKSSSIINDKIEIYWDSPEKLAVTTVVLDPLLDYRPTEYRVNLIRKGVVDKAPTYRTKTSWIRIGDAGLFPSRIVMLHQIQSKAAETAVDVSITWLDRELWSQIGSKSELKELAEKRGTVWQDYFEEKFSKIKKR